MALSRERFSDDLVRTLASVSEEPVRNALVLLLSGNDSETCQALSLRVEALRTTAPTSLVTPELSDRSTVASMVEFPEVSMASMVSSTGASHQESQDQQLGEPVLRGAAHLRRSSRKDEPGDSISNGKYELVRLLGEGGMGSVWEARQKFPLTRSVAIKLIRSDRISPAMLARFDIECQALARMQHPNIAKVIDAGRDETGRPFFTMELVSGLTLMEHCREQRATFTQRLELFVAIASALDHAHRKGILHRDLKPANILVASENGASIPKVIDFGLAKAMSETWGETAGASATEENQIVGTPLYMAPEQLKGSGLDVDTRTDVHALGLVLHELLLGQPPLDPQAFKRASWSEKFRLIEQESWQLPSTRLLNVDEKETHVASMQMTVAELHRRLRGDLDAIITKALEKERDRRYASAAEMADEVRRYLGGYPVQAVPRSRWYVTKKWMARHRVLASATIAVTLSIILGVAGSLVFAWEARRARNVAQVNENIARNQSELALSTMISIVNGLDIELARIPRGQRTRQRILEATLSNLQQISQGLVASELSDETSIVTMLRLSGVLLQLGRGGDERLVEGTDEMSDAVNVSLTLLEPAIARCRSRLKTEPQSNQSLAMLASGLFSLGEARTRLGQTQEAESAFREASETFDALKELDPSDLSWAREAANVATRLGDLRLRQGDLAAANAEYRQALLEIREVLPAALEKDSFGRIEALALEKLGDVALAQEDLAAASSHYEESRQVYENMNSNDESRKYIDKGLAILASKRGDLRLMQDDLMGAETEFLEGLAIVESWWEQDPDDYGTQLDRALFLERLGDLEIRRGDLEAATKRFESLLEQDRQRVRMVPDDVQLLRSVSVTALKMGDLLRQKGELENALDYYTECRETRHRLVEVSEREFQSLVDLAIADSRIGETQIRMDQMDAAEESLYRSLKLREELASNYPEHARPIELLQLIHIQLADLETLRQDPEQAMQHASRSLAYLEQRVAGGADASLGRDLSVAYDRVGSSALELGKVDEALEYFKKAMEIDRHRAAKTPDDVRAQMDLMASHYRIASVAEVLEDWTAALQAYDDAIAIAKRMIEAELYVEEAQAKLEALEEMRRQTEQRRGPSTEAPDDPID